jgi:2'-5' RNA ligase
MSEPITLDSVPSYSGQPVSVVAEVSSGKAIESIKNIQDQVSDFDCLVFSPISRLHISIKYCGELVEQSEEVDEIGTKILSPTDVATITERTRNIANQMEKFPIELSKVDVWPSCLFVDVIDMKQNLHGLNSNLRVPETYTSQYDGEMYNPHIEIAKFRNSTDFEELRTAVSEMKFETLEVQIDTISIVVSQSNNCAISSLERITTFSLNG